MRDVFETRKQTYGLLELICSLDSPCTCTALSLTHPTLIFSGFPDFLTGVYHAYILQRNMKNSKHIVFSMASHFLLIEWPDMVARDIGKFILEDSVSKTGVTNYGGEDKKKK